MGKWFEMKKSGKSGEIHINGVITSEKWYETDVTPTDFQQQLDAMGDVENLDVYINSPGGSVFDGVAIYQAIKRHSAKTRTINDGIAASIASAIFQAGDERVMPEGTMMFVHKPLTVGYGNATDFRKWADELDKVQESIVTTYASRSKLSAKKLNDMMDSESLLSAEDALKHGLADVSDSEPQNITASLEGSLLTVNGVCMNLANPAAHDFSRFKALANTTTQQAPDLMTYNSDNRPAAPVAPQKVPTPANSTEESLPLELLDLEMQMTENDISLNLLSNERS